jgi:hypothetical protein
LVLRQRQSARSGITFGTEMFGFSKQLFSQLTLVTLSFAPVGNLSRRR